MQVLQLAAVADYPIEVITGAEFITGSIKDESRHRTKNGAEYDLYHCNDPIRQSGR